MTPTQRKLQENTRTVARQLRNTLNPILPLSVPKLQKRRPTKKEGRSWESPIGGASDESPKTGGRQGDKRMARPDAGSPKRGPVSAIGEPQP